MARKDMTKVEFAKFQKIAEKLGMTIVAKGGWTKFYAPGTDITKTVRKACLGVPNTKTVTIVELVNFESTEEGVVVHPKPSAKTVVGMVDFGRPENLILRTTYKVAKAICEAAKVVAPAPVEEQVEVVAEQVEQPAEQVEAAVA